MIKVGDTVNIYHGSSIIKKEVAYVSHENGQIYIWVRDHNCHYKIPFHIKQCRKLIKKENKS